MTFHVASCPEAVATCQVEGCHFWGTKGKINEHRKNSALHHVKLLEVHQAGLMNAVLDRKVILGLFWSCTISLF